MSKLKVGLYWAASCGGCEIAVLDINEKILDVMKHISIEFWPVAMDTKYKDVEALPPKYFDCVLFNGGIRNEENLHMAKVMREKSKILIAFGSCANEGSIPGLGNIYGRGAIIERAYKEAESNSKKDMDNGIAPLPEYNNMKLPELLPYLKTLGGVVDVDYHVPGCPPPPELIAEVFEKIISGNLPERGSVLAPETTQCKDCSRNPTPGKEAPAIKEIPEIKRIWEIKDDGRCFLEQGIICTGPVTRSGCNSRCIKGNFPCTGCMGHPPKVMDAGAKLISMLGALMGIGAEKELDEKKAEEMADKIRDSTGTFYLYSFADSYLGRRHMK